MSDPLSAFANEEEQEDIGKLITETESERESNSHCNSDSPIPTIQPECDDDSISSATENVNYASNSAEITSDRNLPSSNTASQNENETQTERYREEGDLPERQSSSLSDNSDILAKIEEEMGNGPKDLDVVVDNPEKIIKTMESYIVFTVKTKTTRSDFENPEYCVFRRYNDFLWLRQQLEESHPLLIIPPLPEKHSLTVDRFDKEFVKFRQVALHRFMTRVTQHVITSQDEILKAFLTLENNEFHTYKKKGTGLISRVAKSLSTKGISLMLKNRSEEHTNIYEYAQSLGQKMGAFERISARVATEQNDYLLALSTFVPAFEDWSNAETDLADNLREFSKLMLSIHDDFKEMVDKMTLDTVLPAKEYILFADSIKGALTRRDAVQHELEVITEELVKCTEEKKQLAGETPGPGGFLSRSNTEEALQAKTEKLTNRISELESAHVKCKSKLDESNSELKTDMERWHINKKTDMKELIGGMAARNVDTYDKVTKCVGMFEGLRTSEGMPALTCLHALKEKDIPTKLKLEN